MALLGEFGAALVRLARGRLPVPPGFVVSAEVCAHYGRTGGRFPAGVWDRIREQFRRLEAAPLHETDAGRRPLLVRFQAAGPSRWNDRAVTLGFNETTARQLQDVTGDTAVPWREFARLIRSYALRAEGMAEAEWEQTRSAVLARYGVGSEASLPSEGCRDLCDAYRRLFQDRTRRPFPFDLLEQTRGMLIALYEEDNAARAGGTDRCGLSIGVPAILSAAVFGNLGIGSAECSAWPRDPVNGACGVRGETATGFGPPAANDAVLAGVPLTDLASAHAPNLRLTFGMIGQLVNRAEELAGWPQRVEFVIERGRLWVVGASELRRTPEAAVRWAVEMAEGRDLASGRVQPRRLTPDKALLMVPPQDLLGRPSVGRRGACARSRARLMEWAEARNPFSLLVRLERIDASCLARTDGAIGAAWWPVGEQFWMSAESEPGGAVGADLLETLMADWRGRPLMIAVPPSADGPASAGVRMAVDNRAAPATAWAIALTMALKRLGRGRGVPRPDIAMPAGDLSDRFRNAIASGRRETAAIEAALHRRIRCPFGILVSVPRAVVAIDTVAEWIDFAIFDVAAIDRIMRGEVAGNGRTGGGSNGLRFDTEGVGVLLEAGIRRFRSVRPAAMFGMAVDRLPDAAFFRFCLRVGTDLLICPPSHTAAVRLAAAQASLGRGEPVSVSRKVR